MRLVRDWYFNNSNALFAHRAVTAKLLSPKENFYENPRRIIADLRRDFPGVEIIGVHIRRGDYNAYEGGRLFYSDEEYLRLMRRAAEASKAAPVFLICSNEPADIEYFRANGANAIASSGHKIEDLAALSLCDKIMGPPSTYSYWAAFISSAPLWHAWSADDAAEFRALEPSEWP